MLKASALRCEWDHQELFSNLTFKVEPGNVLFVSGENGSGKSSLLRVLAGLKEPIEGIVTWQDQILKPGSPFFLSQLVYLGHKIGIQPLLTPRENLKGWLEIHAISASPAEITFALEAVGLKACADTPCEYLSKGQQQRVALARLWICSPPCWILDEPFTALDQNGQDRLVDRLLAHTHQGGCLVVASHYGFERKGFEVVEVSLPFSAPLSPPPQPFPASLRKGLELGEISLYSFASNSLPRSAGEGWGGGAYMVSVLFSIIYRDLKLYFRRRGEWAMPLIFFVMVVSLFPIALGPYVNSLRILTPAVIWVAVVLSLLMSLETVFRVDYQEGILEQFLLSPYPLAVLLLGKSIAHWLAIGVPLIILAPFFSLFLQGSPEVFVALAMTLLLGIPTLSLVGSIGAALTIGLAEGGILLTILVLPLMIPMVIFGASGVLAASQGLPFIAELLWLGALLLLALVLAPVMIAAAIRVSIIS